MVAEVSPPRLYGGPDQRHSGTALSQTAGAFYVFVGLHGLIGRQLKGRTITDGDVFAELLLEQANVAVVPGSGFGTPEYFRLSYATSMERIKAGLDRIEEFVRQIN